MFDPLLLKAPVLQRLDDPFLTRHSVQLDVLRLDLMHPLAGGNKSFKLRWNLAAAQERGHNTMLSFGGAYSNHLLALAVTAGHCGLKTIGLIRGELPEPLNPVLAAMHCRGMHLVPISRTSYRQRSDPAFIDALRGRFGDFYLIPEGGSNEAGVRGCEEIIAHLVPAIDNDSDNSRPYIFVACGTGATLAGLIRGAAASGLNARLRGVAVLKGAQFLRRDVAGWLTAAAAGLDWEILTGYHCGGYARRNAAYDDFLADFAATTDLPIEPVYTGKLMYGVYDQIAGGQINKGSHVIVIHSGGVFNKTI